MLWDSRLGSNPHVEVCRDERCTRQAVHAPHPIRDTPQRVLDRFCYQGWVHDPFERRLKPVRRRGAVTYAPCAAPKSEDPSVLDDCVLEVCSYSEPKSKGMIHMDLENVYGGGCIDRRLFRSLSRLSGSGRLLRFDLSEFNRGGSLYAYLLPSSRIRHDPRQIFETLTDRFESGPGKSLAPEVW